MAHQEHLDRLKQGVKTWNQWRQEYLGTRPDLRGADLKEADLRGADLKEVDLEGADLRRASLRDADLIVAHLHGANFSGARLGDAYLRGADLSEADFRGADLHRANLSDANLRGTDLSRAHLRRADLSGALLGEANLRRANLSEADLSRAHLGRANLSEADLSRAHLDEANLSEADLSEADLRSADLGGADLGGADFHKVHLLGTVFANNDLRTVKGLLEIHYRGPSRVELHTVRLPQDGSAFHFLRGTGIPNEWIDVYRAQMHSPIQYHSCFISHSSKDDLLARRLHADLQDHGVRCWFAPEDLKIGDKMRPRIDEAIHLQDKLLLLLSEHALASSWVEDEVEAALEKERRQQREVLFPVRLDECVMQASAAWAASLRRTRHIGDFTHWTDPQAYQQAFERLLRDLKKADREETEDGGN